MYVPHPSAEPPEDENAKIWRYMDFTKLVTLLSDKKMFFTRSGAFEDRFEGSYPHINSDPDKFAEYILANRRDEFPQVSGPPNPDQIERMAKLRRVTKATRRFLFVNCWHLNEHESAAMWGLYLKSHEGIAVQSTYRRLVESLSGTPEEVHIGKVKYIDYTKDVVAADGAYYLLMHKRKSFEHENELRAIIRKFPNVPGAELAAMLGLDSLEKLSEKVTLPGISVDVDLDILIENVYVAPNSPAWFHGVVRSVLEKFGPSKTVVKSSLDDDPIF